MTAATDTLAERLAAYRRLFAEALISAEPTETVTTLRLTDTPDVRDSVLDLARREAVCCPSVSHDVSTDGGQIVWQVRDLGPAESAFIADLVAESAR